MAFFNTKTDGAGALSEFEIDEREFEQASEAVSSTKRAHLRGSDTEESEGSDGSAGSDEETFETTEISNKRKVKARAAGARAHSITTRPRATAFDVRELFNMRQQKNS